MSQGKGLVAIVWGGVQLKGLAEDSITYDVGELGDSLNAADAVVHVRRNPNSVVTAVTVNVVKGTKGVDAILLLIAAGVPLPLTINDAGTGVKAAMLSANATTVGIGGSTGGNDVESNTFIFKGNLQIISLEG